MIIYLLIYYYFAYKESLDLDVLVLFYQFVLLGSEVSVRRGRHFGQALMPVISGGLIVIGLFLDEPPIFEDSEQGQYLSEAEIGQNSDYYDGE
jgi:hypothetical protein